jgi:hypothetical protein
MKLLSVDLPKKARRKKWHTINVKNAAVKLVINSI